MKRFCFTPALGLLLWALSLPTSAQTQIQLEPQGAVLGEGFVLTNGCICQPVASDSLRGGRAVFSFTLTNSGEYAIRAAVLAPAGQDNAFSVNIDKEPDEASMVWDIAASSGFADKFVTWRGPARNGTVSRQQSFLLSAGPHQLIIRGLTPNTKIARVWLHQRTLLPPNGLRPLQESAAPVNRPAPPANLRVVGVAE
jgi:hypothetical protein